MDDSNKYNLSVVERFGKRSILFPIELKNSNLVFMRVDEDQCLDEKRRVVIVDSAKLLSMWKAEPHGFNHDLSHGTPNDWESFSKYPKAAEGFSMGLNNPVPIARVVCGLHKGTNNIYERRFGVFKKLTGRETFSIPFLEIDNGRTRTIWLLNHGAAHFPVECTQTSGVALLLETCGDQSFGSPSIKNILGKLTNV